MTTWIRCLKDGAEYFARLDGDVAALQHGDLFDDLVDSGIQCSVDELELLYPFEPGKYIGLWNNFHERAELEGLSKPPHPLYFSKLRTCQLAPGGVIPRPEGYDGPVVFEGELGIVIGATAHCISPEQADEAIFGYTCVNDVTARAILKSDPTFPQWVRAKSFDGFGPFGPGVVTDIDPAELRVQTWVNGECLQDYPVSDMFYSPQEIVSRLSHDMTLEPGDLIACGTSVGASAMPDGCTVDVVIEGVGRLSNRFFDLR
ncbi:MAG: fumarylacetoacetate hydrolase family protein [Gammaproteobacteria bacterium]